MEKVEVTLKDLELVVQLIDTVAERGAFKGDELITVGQLRQKIVAFAKQQIEEAQKAQEKEAEKPKKSASKMLASELDKEG